MSAAQQQAIGTTKIQIAAARKALDDLAGALRYLDNGRDTVRVTAAQAAATALAAASSALTTSTAAL